MRTGKVEKNIYLERRGPSLRFSVEVSPFKKQGLTVDPEQYDAGLSWARQKRVDLLKAKAGGPLTEPIVALVSGTVPSGISVSEVIESYRVRELSRLSGASSDASRLKRLAKWFGHLNLGGLTYDVLERWRDQRLAGLLGSGRRAPDGLTKHQRHYRRGAGKELPTVAITPVSTQTVRHELVLLRRAVTAYFRAHALIHEHGGWLAAQHVMLMALPEKSDPRETRVDAHGFATLVAELDEPLRAFVQLAVLTTLRRTELCSLRWEDLDLEASTIKLRTPGHRRKTKTHGRDVPLLPPAIEVLQRLGVRARGQIFDITPSGISQAMRRAADRAGLHDLRLHDLRREGISRLVELLEVPLETVIAFSGHTDLAVLQRHYVKQKSSVIAARLAAHPRMAKLIGQPLEEKG